MMMKLVFPAGDRPQLLLGQGVHRIGSASGADVALPASDDVAPLHCELQVGPQGVQLRVPPGLRVAVNERPVDGLIALRAEDTIGVGAARMRLLPVAAGDGAAAGAGTAENEPGETISAPGRRAATTVCTISCRHLTASPVSGGRRQWGRPNVRHRSGVISPCLTCCGSSLTPGLPRQPTSSSMGMPFTAGSARETRGLTALPRPEFCM